MTIDATQVTGSPHAGAGARPGDVLAERYELLEAIDVEGPSVGYRALDQETERTVLVRTLVGAPLDHATLADSVERLKALVGAGGRHLSALLDADREGRRPFTVEAWPRGTQLSAILQARRARGEPLGAREVLPIAAQIAAALAALPRGWHHGDVRAERVFVDTDGLRLTGAFLLSALPGRALAERMAAIGPAAVAYAPEQASGRPSPASDRWGAAALIWEALTLRAPDRTSAPRELSPGVLTALRRLLDPEPGRRPADLSGLLEALARQAGVPVPTLDPAATAPRPAGVGVDATGPRASADDTSKQPAVTGALDSSEDGLDPRLVRAALGITMESLEQDAVVLESDPGLDPRLVRAALGVVSEEQTSSMEELSSVEELLSTDEEELALEDEPPVPAPRPEPVAKPRRPVQAAPAPKPAPAPSPAVVQPAPPQEAPRRAAQGHDGGTAVIPRPVEPSPAPRPARRTSGVVIVVGALILAVLIVGIGFLVRALLSQERSSAERSRQIQERLEQIRSEEASPR